MPEEVKSPTDMIYMKHPDVPASTTQVIRSAYDTVWEKQGWVLVSDNPAEYEEVIEAADAERADVNNMTSVDVNTTTPESAKTQQASGTTSTTTATAESQK